MAYMHGRTGYSPDRLYLRQGAEKILDMMGRLALGYDENSRIEYMFRCHETKASQYNVSGFEFTISKKEDSAVNMWNQYYDVTIQIASVWLLGYKEYLDAVIGIIKPFWELSRQCNAETDELFKSTENHDDAFWAKFHAICDKYHKTANKHYMVGFEPVNGSSCEFINFATEDSKRYCGMLGKFVVIGANWLAYKLESGSIARDAYGNELIYKDNALDVYDKEQKDVAKRKLIRRMTEEMRNACLAAYPELASEIRVPQVNV